MEISSPWFALIGALFSGVVLKLAEYFLSRNQTKDDSALKMRNELREDLYKVKEEPRTAEIEIDSWKEKYYTLREEYIQIKSDLENALGKILKEVNETKH